MELEISLLCSQEHATDICIETNPVHTFQPVSLRTILILFSHLCICFHVFIPSGFQIKVLYAYLITPMHAKFLACLILFHVFTMTVFGEEVVREMRNKNCGWETSRKVIT